jgi:gamma-F420-2:alpha-L-glutamate ligase
MIQKKEFFMRGWILFNYNDKYVKELYELEKLIQVGKKRNIDIRIVTPEQFDLVVTHNNQQSILLEGKRAELPDFFLPRIGATTSYFALALIRHMERLGVPTFNSSQSIDIVRDKLYMNQILAEHNLPVPKTMLVKYLIDGDLVEKELGFPVILKTITGTLGIGVYLCKTKKHFNELVEFITASAPNANIIIQEFIKESIGRDLRIFVVDGKTVGCMERIAKKGDFKANFSRGGEVRPYKLTPEIEKLAVNTAQILGLDITGIDLLFDGKKFKICEANSAPGFEGLEKACKVSIPDQIYDFIIQKLT